MSHLSAGRAIVLPDAAALAHAAARRFVAASQQAVALHGRFTLALAGGSTPAGLYRLLAEAPYREQVDWQRAFIYFGDERCVPLDHPDSNYGMAHAALLDRVAVPHAQVFPVMGELPPVEAADRYERVLRAGFGLGPRDRPHFDLLLLGLGDDGHTASLFPGMPALAERKRLAVATEAPSYARPPVSRVTLTLPVLNAARQVMFLVAGAAKAEAVEAILGETRPGRLLPAGRVQPRLGQLIWLLDEPAARKIGSREDQEGQVGQGKPEVESLLAL